MMCSSLNRLRFIVRLRRWRTLPKFGGVFRSQVISGQQDYLAVQAKGYVGGWYLNRQRTVEYVLVNNKKTGNNCTVARLIMDPPRGYVVRYRNGNRKDLRRSNLYLQTRKALNREIVDQRIGVNELS